jgi:radical SAM protein with 4Fe4S-binding SPASM domain
VSTSKLGKNQWADLSPQKKNPFELPRLITRHLKQCAESQAAGRVAPLDEVKYLWIAFRAGDAVADDAANDGATSARRALNADEWKNVIDEAASLGVRVITVCVGPGLTRSQDLWDICQWAQNTHEMKVALFVSDEYDLGLLQYFSKLNLGRTVLLAPQSRLQEARPFADSGIEVCVADVSHGEHPMPCNGPRSMVYVEAGGKLYPCGLVSGNEQYLLGDVLEDPLAPIHRNDGLPWTVDDTCNPAGCDACPNIMDKRMAGGAR